MDVVRLPIVAADRTLGQALDATSAAGVAACVVLLERSSIGVPYLLTDGDLLAFEQFGFKTLDEVPPLRFVFPVSSDLAKALGLDFDQPYNTAAQWEEFLDARLFSFAATSLDDLAMVITRSERLAEPITIAPARCTCLACRAPLDPPPLSNGKCPACGGPVRCRK